MKDLIVLLIHLLACASRKLIGDWRMSNINELTSLIDYTQSDPALPEDHPFENISFSSYWSSTNSSSNALGVWFSSGAIGNFSKTSSGGIWPVRGGLK
jgi:hypothetical protein